MVRFLGSALLLAMWIVAGAAFAADEPSSQAVCMASLKDVQVAFEERDIGEKASAEVQTLIDVTESLCERGNFADAKTLTDLARSMLATE